MSVDLKSRRSEMMMPKLWLEVKSRVKSYRERMVSSHRQRSSIGVWSVDTGPVPNDPSHRSGNEGIDRAPVHFRSARYRVVRNGPNSRVLHIDRPELG